MKLSIGFTGDIAFSEYMKDFSRDKKNIDKQIYSFLNSNDYNVLNFESPITDSKTTSKDYLAHKSDSKSLLFLKDNINNSIFSLANNHMMDYGRKGLSDTLDNLKKNKLSYIGAGTNLDDALNPVILGDKVKVGIISFQYKNYKVADKNNLGTLHEKYKRLIKKKIKELKKEVNWVVVVYHGGEEFINTPMPYTRRKLHRILKWGADIVVAHHPHTVQGYEKVHNKMIFYSLGNFLFDTEFQRVQDGTDKGMLLRLIFTDNSYTYETLFISNNREDNKIITKRKNDDFRNIKLHYRRNYKKDARRFDDIRKRQKKLRIYRSKYSISDLNLERDSIKELISFDTLVSKYNVSDIESLNVKEKNKLFKKIDKIIFLLKNANYRKRFYSFYAKIFRW